MKSGEPKEVENLEGEMGIGGRIAGVGVVNKDKKEKDGTKLTNDKSQSLNFFDDFRPQRANASNKSNKVVYKIDLTEDEVHGFHHKKVNMENLEHDSPKKLGKW